MLRDVAGELTIAQDAVDRERGVVLSEERARDTPSYRIFTDRFSFLLKGQRPPQRLPIGKVEVLEDRPARSAGRLLQRLLPTRTHHPGRRRRPSTSTP